MGGMARSKTTLSGLAGLQIVCQDHRQGSTRETIAPNRPEQTTRPDNFRVGPGPKKQRPQKQRPTNQTDLPEYPAWRFAKNKRLLCDRWQDFATYRSEVPKRPSKHHQLARLDTDKPFEPGNVYWGLPLLVNAFRRVRKSGECWTTCPDEFAKSIDAPPVKSNEGRTEADRFELQKIDDSQPWSASNCYWHHATHEPIRKLIPHRHHRYRCWHFRKLLMVALSRTGAEYQTWLDEIVIACESSKTTRLENVRGVVRKLLTTANMAEHFEPLSKVLQT